MKIPRHERPEYVHLRPHTLEKNRRKPLRMRWIMRGVTASITIASILSIFNCWTAPGVLDVFACVMLMLSAFASALLTP